MARVRRAAGPLFAVTVALVLADSAVVTLALPDILRHLHTTVGEVAWVLIAFNLVLGLGAVPTAVLATRARPPVRSGGRAGDMLYVTGTLGGPGAALDALLRGATPRDVERARFAAPRPRIAEGLWLAEHGARAAIDISDGLAADAGHLAAASGARVVLDLASLPCIDGIAPERAASSGEEYELLVAFAPDVRPDARAFREQFGIPLSAVGHVTEGSGVSFEVGGERVALRPGHDHLS
jgi:thiamine-monophosphate kinase